MAGVKQARDGAVAILTLDEPASLNAMTPDLLGALAVAVGEMTQDEGVRALILRRRARLLLGTEFEGLRSARRGHRGRRDALLLAGLQGVA